MGTGASSNSVQEIKIDQNDEQWDRYAGGSRQKRSLSKFSVVGQRLRKSASSLRSGSSAERDRRLQQMRTALEAAEKRSNDQEDRVRQLHREVATLELRNIELAAEVTWLKQQVGRPEMPVHGDHSRPGTASLLLKETCEEKEKQWLNKLRAVSKQYEHDRDQFEQKVENEKKVIRAELEDTRYLMSERIKQLEQQMHYGNSLNKHLESLVQSKMGKDSLSDAKTAAQIEVAAAGRQSAQDLLNKSQNNRAQLILDLSNEVSQKCELIRKLEEDVVRRDVEIAQLKEISSAGDKQAPDSVAEHTVQKFSARHIQNSEREQREEEVVDEIEALLKSPQPLLTPTPTNEASKVHSQQVPTEPMHTVSTSAVKNQDVGLRNVFTLSESMEPIRVVDSWGAVEERPATAYAVDRPLTGQTAVLTASNNGFCVVGRGSSAPILFKASKSRKNRRKDKTKEDDSDLQSIYGDECGEETSTQKHAELTEDDINQILNESIPNFTSSFKRSTGSNARVTIGDSSSAKSRDSGYLGDSTTVIGQPQL